MQADMDKLIEMMARSGYIEYSDKAVIDEYDWSLAFPHTLKLNGRLSEQELFTKIAKGMLSVIREHYDLLPKEINGVKIVRHCVGEKDIEPVVPVKE